MQKKYYEIYYVLGAAALAMAFAIPVSRAQTIMDTEGSAEIGASIDNGPAAAGATSMRDRIASDIKTNNANIKNNRGVRNNTLEGRFSVTASTGASTTSSAGNEGDNSKGRGNRGQDGQGNGNGDNTSPTESDGGLKNMLRVRKDVFDQQKTHLIQQLNRALANLMQIETRIKTRIATAGASGRNMDAANAALKIADTKLAAAQTAINALAGLNPVIATTSATTTVTATIADPNVDLSKARQVGAAAIQAVKDAQRALNAVVVAIAHSMGLKVGQDGTIIPPSPSPSPSASASVSPSPSGSVSPSPSPSVSASASPSPSDSVSPSPSDTASPSPSTSASPSPSTSASPSPSTSASPSPSDSTSPSPSVSISPSVSPTP